MITLSTYTEPPQVIPVLSELSQTAAVQNYDRNPQAEALEEDSEPSGFAELLAGIMQQKNGAENEAVESVQLDVFSGIEFDAINGAQSGSEVNVFGELPENGKVSRTGLFSDLEETEFFPEQENVLFGAENLLTRLEPVVSDESTVVNEDLSRKISDLKTDNDLAALQSEADLSPLVDTAEADKLSQAAALNAKEALNTEVKNKKAKPGSENVQENAPQKSRSEETASFRPVNEKESRGKLDEARRAKGKEKVTFEVRDFRTSSGAEGQKSVEIRVNAGMENQSRAQGAVREVTLELRLPEQAQNSAQTSWEAKADSALENMLARELHQNFNGDIVRHASMALKDGGEGTIRLALKPESLGNVKIHLEMAENKITGRIVVESEEALNAFRKELDSLEQAFRDSGFTNADLNLSLSADGRNAQGNERDAALPLPMVAASRYDNSFGDSADQNLTSIVDVFYGRKQGSVNMLA